MKLKIRLISNIFSVNPAIMTMSTTEVAQGLLLAAGYNSSNIYMGAQYIESFIGLIFYILK